MQLPTLISKFYVLGSKAVPEKWKPELRGLYYRMTKLMYYGTTDMPAAVDIETASRCNMKCSYCPVMHYDRGNHFMEEDLFKKVIDELADMGFRGRVSPHFCGEPLIDKRLPDLMAYVRTKLPRANLVIHTNGLLLNEELFGKFERSGLDGFVLTLHNEKVKDHIEELMRALGTNRKSKIRIMDFEKKHLFNRGGLVKVKNRKTLKRCHYISDEIAIDWKGDVVCTNDFFTKHSFGNLKSEKLTDIWNSDRFAGFRKDVRKGKFNLDICKECTKYSRD